MLAVRLAIPERRDTKPVELRMGDGRMVALVESFQRGDEPDRAVRHGGYLGFPNPEVLRKAPFEGSDQYAEI